MAVAGGLAVEKQSLAAGLLNGAAQPGSAWGIGAIAAVVAATTAALGGESASPEAMVGGLGYGLLAGFGFVVLVLLMVLFLRGEQGRKGPSAWARG